MGAYALRPMSTGEILDGALTLLRRHFGLLCGLAIVCQGLPTALDVYLDLTGGSARHQGLSLLDRLLTWLGSLLVRGGAIWVVSETYLGRAPRLRDALRFAGDHVGQVFTAGLASGLVTLLATVGLVIPGIVVYCGYSVVLQVAVLEPRGSSGALGRSWDLTKGYKWKALGLWAVSLALLIVLFAGTTAIGAVAEQVQAVQVTSAVLSAGAQLLIYPLIGCVFTLFYYDPRIRKEGFDLEVLSQSLSS